MKILIYGSNGWIGKQFCNILNNSNEQYIEGKVRVNDIKSLKKEINLVNPTHIVCFIGRTHGKIGNTVISTIDYLEESGKLVDNLRDNLFSPVSLAIICNQLNIHLTYLGTGCIFNYDNEHEFEKEINGFTEESLPNFYGSSYSIVKGFTDELMHLFEDNILNLRIRMPITNINNSRNFITKITKYEKICSIKNSMSVLPELLPLVYDMIKNKTIGTINLTNPGLISHNEILEMYKDIVDKNFTWKNFSKDEQSLILKSDRSNNYLDTKKLQDLYPQVKNIKESITVCLKNYK